MPVRPFGYPMMVPPPPMMMPQPPAPWRTAVDPTSRLPYYYNEKTGATQWDFPQPEPPPPSKAIPMPDPDAEPEAYEAWKSVMQHVRGGMAAKMTGRDQDGVVVVARPTDKQCNDFAQGKCHRGANCKFMHGDVRPSDARTGSSRDAPAPARDERRARDYYEDHRSRRRRRDDVDDDRGRRRRRYS